jgi:DNA-binding NarL/FixJ family response regulator
MCVTSLQRVFAQEPDFVVVGCAASFAEARAGIAAAGPDVVLMSWSLPDAPGGTSLSELRRVSPASRFLVLAEAADARLGMAAIDAGAAGIVDKTRPVDELLAALRIVARGDVHLPPPILTSLVSRMRSDYHGVGSNLTDRERDVLRLVGEGLTNAAIARSLSISVNTVRNYVAALLDKLGAHSKLEALAVAVREGLLSNYASPPPLSP